MEDRMELMWKSVNESLDLGKTERKERAPKCP
jgi:hypothetical protein